MEEELIEYAGCDDLASVYANKWFVATVSALTFVYVITLII